MRKPIRGFTLIELAVGLVLTAVALSIAVPALTRFLAGQRITAATNLVMGQLQYARSEAITRHLPVIACPSRNQEACEGNRWDRGWMIFVDPDRDGAPNRDDEILRVAGPIEQVHIHSRGRYRARFQANGSAYGSNLTIRVCDPSGRAEGRGVVVSNPGRARVERRLSPARCQP